jgi:hypothetical protein
VISLVSRVGKGGKIFRALNRKRKNEKENISL